eukprot:Awhi_evm1s9647
MIILDSKMSWKVGQLGEDNCQSSFNGFAPVVPSVTTISDPHSDISFATPVDPPVSSIPCFLDEYKNPDYEPSRQFSFDQGGYNVIIDKSTFDCLLCSENSSNYICDIMGLLSGDGVYFLISFHPPGFIMPLFEAPANPIDTNVFIASEKGPKCGCKICSAMFVNPVLSFVFLAIVSVFP